MDNIISPPTAEEAHEITIFYMDLYGCATASQITNIFINQYAHKSSIPSASRKERRDILNVFKEAFEEAERNKLIVLEEEQRCYTLFDIAKNHLTYKATPGGKKYLLELVSGSSKDKIIKDNWVNNKFAPYD